MKRAAEPGRTDKLIRELLCNGLKDINFGVVLWRLKATGTEIIDWRPACERLFGWKREEVLGKSFLDLVFADSDRPSVAELVSMFEANDHRRILRKDCRTKRGGTVFVKWSNTPVYHAETGCFYVISLADEASHTSAIGDTAGENRADTQNANGVGRLAFLGSVPNLKNPSNIELDEFYQGMVNLIPYFWPRPEETCARIITMGKEFRSGDFEVTGECQSADFHVYGEKAGTVKVCRCRGNVAICGKLLGVDRTLVESAAREIGIYTERRLADQALHETHEQLETERAALEKKNIALREILNEIENEKRQVARQIQDNIDKAVRPILRSLAAKYPEVDVSHVQLLDRTLSEIASPFINQLESKFSRLSPREVEICNMVQAGMATKEIAGYLSISEQTVIKQRKRIRKKLGIAGQEVNLVTFLKSI